jgi:hypothetical protein
MATENLTLAEFFGNQRNPANYAKVEQIERDISTAWLTLDEITQQLNLFQDESQDSYLQMIELATRMAIEDYLGFPVFPIGYKVYYAGTGVFGSALYLDLPEVSTEFNGNAGVTINMVQYYNNANVLTTLPANSYFYDSTGNRVVVTSMPNTVSQYYANPIMVKYTQNSNFIMQYPVVKQAALLMLTHIYNNRSETSEKSLVKLPWGVDQLLRPYKALVM